MKRSFREGRFTIELPEDRYFRFESCETYVGISGKDVKEMDFGWLDAGGDTLWLMEFKDYDQEDAPPPDRACRIRPLVVVNLRRADASRLIGALKSEVNAELDGILDMFGIGQVTIITVRHPMIEDKLGIRITSSRRGGSRR
jgi:hypothetical protein